METILGIDLGTTNSEVAVYRDGRPEVLADDDGDPILPSVVGLDAEGKLLVGKAARNQYALAPERTIKSIKRIMGQETTVELGGKNYSPQEISAIILRTLKERAEKRLGESVGKAVITVPAFFTDGQRDATREAGRLAGLEVVRIINEPTAASLAYEPNSEVRERLCVYDLGGGTFDVSIVQIERGVVEVLSSHGDTKLGGDDFDQVLFDAVCSKFLAETSVDLRLNAASKARVLFAVEQAKKELSFAPVAKISEEFIAEKDGVPLHLVREVERYEYEELIEPLLSRTLACVDRALEEAKLTAADVDDVILVGGATRTPAIHELLEERLGRPPHIEVEPDLCVAMGASMQAAMIAGVDVGPVLVDITPRTLGIAIVGELAGFESIHCFAPIIRKNSPLPISRTESYATHYDDQTQAEIIVFQGEDPDTRHNEKVGEFMIEGLKKGPAGNQILVRFDLDLNGMLTVSATEHATGMTKKVAIEKPMERFRRAHLHDAEERIAAVMGAAPAAPKAAAETPTAEGSGAGAAKLLGQAARLLPKASGPDAEELQKLMGDLGNALESGDAAAITSVSERLEDLVFYLQDA